MKRRDFLHATAGAAALVTVPPVFAARGDERIRVGQIGTKHAHASGHMETMRKLTSVFDVVGVVEPDAARRKQITDQPSYQGVPVLTEEQLLNIDGLRAVAVETEVRDLLATAQRCVDAGMHVHVDKPAGEDFAALRRLHRTAESKSLLIQMGYMYRYNHAFQFVHRAVRDGWLGNVFEIHGVMSKKVGAAARQQLAQYAGGAMFELGCHLIDPIVNLLGTPQKVTSFNRKTQDDDLLDNTFAVFEFPRATASVRSSLVEVDGFRRRQFVVCGDKGTITIRPLEPPVLELTLETPHGDFQRGAQIVTLPESPGRYVGTWEEFGAAIQGRVTFPFSHEHDLTVQRAVLTASGYAKWDDPQFLT